MRRDVESPWISARLSTGTGARPRLGRWKPSVTWRSCTTKDVSPRTIPKPHAGWFNYRDKGAAVRPAIRRYLNNWCHHQQVNAPDVERVLRFLVPRDISFRLPDCHLPDY